MWGLSRRRVYKRTSCEVVTNMRALPLAADWCRLPGWIGWRGPSGPVVGFDVRCPLCREYHVTGEEHVCMVLPTKADAERLRSPSSSSANAGTLLQAFPELLAFLSLISLPDGTRRSPGKMSLSLESGMWQVALTDSETSLYACLTGADLDDLLLLVEERLVAGTLPWRPSRYGSGKSRKGH